MASDKTEKATSRRRQRAQDEGQFAYSQEVTGALTLFAAIVVLSYLYVNPLGFRAFFERMLQAAMTADSDTAFGATIRQSGTYVLMILVPVFAATCLPGIYKELE